MLIQISAGYPGLTMLQVRGSRMMTHIPFQLQKRDKKKQMSCFIHRHNPFRKFHLKKTGLPEVNGKASYSVHRI